MNATGLEQIVDGTNRRPNNKDCDLWQIKSFLNEMYESIQRNSSNEKFQDRYTCGDTDPQNHARLRFFNKNGKKLNQLKILNINFIENI